ncbi:MAG: VWA domain-containing protein [Verrucomicrobiales bacterium]|jgi:hypothetical protein|nr:VWA domain-containing protein [Verrucomicrobiales bacterium]
MNHLAVTLLVLLPALLVAVFLLDRLGRVLRRHTRRQRWRQRRRQLWFARRRARLRAWLTAQWQASGGRPCDSWLCKKVWQVWLVSLLAHLAALTVLGLLLRYAPPPPGGSFGAVTEQAAPPPLLDNDDAPDTPDADNNNSAPDTPDHRPGDALSSLSVSNHAAALFTLPVTVSAGVTGSAGAGLAAVFGRDTGSQPGPKGLQIPTLNLGGMEVPTDVAVVCDLSGSMEIYLKAITAQIQEQFPGLPVFYAENSRGEFGKKTKPAPSQWHRELSSYENLYTAIRAATRGSSRIGGVYVMSDLQDGDVPTDTEKLLEELTRRRLKLYLCYPATLPYSGFQPLLDYARATGGVEKFRRR